MTAAVRSLARKSENQVGVGHAGQLGPFRNGLEGRQDFCGSL